MNSLNGDDRFDPEYVEHYRKVADRIGLVEMFFSDWKVSGVEKIRTPRQKVYFPNHLSHFDYVAMWHAFLSQGIKLPRFAAGRNLDFRFPLARRMGLDFGKQGVFFVDREQIARAGIRERAHIGRELDSVVQGLLDAGQDIAVFTEGGRSYDRQVMPDAKKVKKFSFVETTRPKGGELRDLDVVPVAVGYDRRVEAGIFPLLNMVKGRMGVIGKGAYYTLDIGSFVGRWLGRKLYLVNGGKCYINFGQPIPIREALADVPRERHWSYLRGMVVGEVRKLYAEIEGMKQRRS